jgi:SAM-dependent methyltransferase
MPTGTAAVNAQHGTVRAVNEIPAMRRYYDSGNDRLVYVGRAADADAWNDWWRTDALRRAVTGPRNWFVVGNTKRHLAPGARVLDGGCGRGDKVFALRRAGFDAIGLDFAEETTRAVHAAVPELPVVCADVRRLPFADASFDGYWSLGVIEHFFDGYGDIQAEIRRVLRPGGTLFLTFPSISPLNRLGIRRGAYPPFRNEAEERAAFWQFGFASDTIANDFARAGFDLVHQEGRGGMIGVRQEAGALGRALHYVETHQGFLPVRAFFVVGNLLLSPFAYHIRFLVLRKR